MAQIKLIDIGKCCVSKGDDFAVRGVSYTVEDEEFVSLLGPSGCGKPTTLNMIVGLESVSEGTIEIDGVSVGILEPHRCDLAFVFQDYALYPRLSVYENIALRMRMRRMPKTEIVTRAREAAEQLGLVEQLRKCLKVLSGGQRQRVALARATAHRPGVLLHNELLSNLDTLLRDRTRVELKLLHNEIGATSIYVTHDREEAMSLSHRIAVMSRGRLEQYGSPEEIYSRPAAEFAAGFVGKPRVNPFTAEPLEKGLVAVSGTGSKVDLELPELQGKTRIGLRPSECHVISASEEAAAGEVAVIEPLGTYNGVIVDTGGGELFIAYESGFPKARVGDHVTIDPWNAVRHVFDTETNLRRGWGPGNPGHRVSRWGTDSSAFHPSRADEGRWFPGGPQQVFGKPFVLQVGPRSTGQRSSPVVRRCLFAVLICAALVAAAYGRTVQQIESDPALNAQGIPSRVSNQGRSEQLISDYDQTVKTNTVLNTSMDGVIVTLNMSLDSKQSGE